MCNSLSALQTYPPRVCHSQFWIQNPKLLQLKFFSQLTALICCRNACFTENWFEHLAEKFVSIKLLLILGLSLGGTTNLPPVTGTAGTHGVGTGHHGVGTGTHGVGTGTHGVGTGTKCPFLPSFWSTSFYGCTVILIDGSLFTRQNCLLLKNATIS